MHGSIARSIFAAAAILTLAASLRAQTEKWKIDADHSHATLLLISSRAHADPRVAGIARVSGLANLKDENPPKLALRLSVYPEGEGTALLTEDDTFRSDALAALAYYSLLSFQSEQTGTNARGIGELTGDLSVTHVNRTSSEAWSVSYAGAQYAEPVKKSASREVRLTLATSPDAIASGEKVGLLKLLLVADIARADFPELWTSLADSIWPPMVDDKSCLMPPLHGDMRAYRGAVCTGTVIGPAAVPDAFDGEAPMKLSAAANRAAADKIRIVFQLRLKTLE